MKRLCVFCGSSPGHDPAYGAAADALGMVIAGAGLGLVYGGASVGLMGRVADAALAAGGEVIGVLPEALQARELAHPGLTELHITPSMHARKAMMAALSDGFVALPGGIGTLEELFEIWTWAQLGDHARPIGLLDVAGFWRPLLGFVDGMVAAGFLRQAHRDIAIHDDDAGRLIDRMAAYSPAPSPKWIDATA